MERPLTNPWAGGSVASNLGTKYAIDMVNEKGGVEGYKIRPIYADAQSKVDVSIYESERLLNLVILLLVARNYTTKEQIRAASREWGLPTWDKPAAACLSSRVAYGIEVSPFRLARVERAELAVRAALEADGVHVRNLRVRDVGDVASIELDRDILDRALRLPSVVEAAVEAGFGSARVDEKGFRSGAMNELLSEPERYR